MTISDVISLLSGIAMFLFGMTLMGDGLKRVSGNKLEPILYRLSDTPLKGLLLGSAVTAVIQSSSATSVIIVGFVNSGMMKLKQAIPVILGAIFGTSITGWVLCLSYIEGTGGISELLSTSSLAGIVAVAGIILRMFSKNKLHHHIGDIMMGFAILMTGMSSMSGSVGGLKEQAWFNSMLGSMKNPVLGILAGVLIAGVLQSASAAVGIVQALSVTGAIAFESALPLLMGITIGASFPVLLAAIGTSTDARRTAFSYPAASIMGVMTCASVYYIFDAVFRMSFAEAAMNPFSIAFVNTLLRLALTCLLVPFTDILEALVCLMVPGKSSDTVQYAALDERFARYPTLAITQSRSVIVEMAKLSEQAVAEAGILISRFSDSGFERVSELENAGDHYEDILGSFLMKLSEQDLSESQGQQSSLFLHTLSDFERISDYALNIAENAREISEKQVEFSEDAVHELNVLLAAVREILQVTTASFTEEDISLAERVEPLEEVIDNLCSGMKLSHVERLQQGKCSIKQGFVFNDLITHYERISDHCSNIAAALIEICSGSFATHEYIGNLKEKRTRYFEQYYNEYKARFRI